MSTTDARTGAEDVAWDLSDLYSGIDDPRIDEDAVSADADAEAFHSRYHGRVAALSAAELAEAMDERERIESVFTRAIYYAHLVFSTDMAAPAHGALLARLQERGATMETKLLFFGLEWAAVEDATAEELLADPAVDTP